MISWKLEALSSSPSSPQHHHVSDRWGGVTSFLFIHHSASHRCHNISHTSSAYWNSPPLQALVETYTSSFSLEVYSLFLLFLNGSVRMLQQLSVIWKISVLIDFSLVQLHNRNQSQSLVSFCSNYWAITLHKHMYNVTQWKIWRAKLGVMHKRNGQIVWNQLTLKLAVAKWLKPHEW